MNWEVKLIKMMNMDLIKIGQISPFCLILNNIDVCQNNLIYNKLNQMPIYE